MRKYFGLISWALGTLAVAYLLIIPEYVDNSHKPVYINVQTYGEKGDYLHVVKMRYQYMEALKNSVKDEDLIDYGFFIEVRFNSKGQEEFLYKMERLLLKVNKVSPDLSFVSKQKFNI